MSPLQLIRLLLLSYILRYSGLNLFPKSFAATVSALTSSNHLHISGGGNLNSMWPGHIYYRCLMIYLASLFKVPVILTSQTIGPINSKFQHQLLKWSLSKTKFIGLRDKDFSGKYLSTITANRPLITSMLDDAQFMKCTAFNIKGKISSETKKTSTQINVGLSLHNWTSNTDLDWLASELTQLGKQHTNVKFFIIPHLVENANKTDVRCMTKLLSALPKNQIDVFDYSKIINAVTSINEIPELIWYITSQMDLTISSRYHGLVFACGASVPAVTINFDDYYKAKNEGILALYYKQPYVLSKGSGLLAIFSNILTNIDDIRRILKGKNAALEQIDQAKLQSLINEFIK